MKLLIGLLFFCSFQLFSQSYLNILLSNDSYKNSQIGELKKITFSSIGDVINFHLADGSTVSESTANVKRFIFSNTPQGTPLPVELSSFNAVQIGSLVLLRWKTETEINNFGFDIERCALSAECQVWDKIGFVNGNGNSNSPKEYSFTDNPATGNKYYYRLKQIDSDGQTEYSNVISIDLNIPNQYALYQNYPNPFNPTTSITYNLPADGLVLLKVFDVLGSEVATLVSENQKSGVYTIPFDGKELSSGIYICKITADNFNSSIKMILMK
jgi:Secretion system C-terminal sorting domain